MENGNKIKIKEFVSKYIKKTDLSDSDNFFASGRVNSLFAMQLVMFVEKEFNIKIENDDLDLKNFHSINAISEFVKKKSNNVIFN
jgi:acyl carrier protein